ncbi:MAG: hypothetical protein ACI4KG_05085 [Oscillospiraceae bacterium]
MLKRGIKYLVVMLAAAVLMTGCGEKFSFSQAELTNAIGEKKAYFDKMEIKPVDDGETGNELMEQAKTLGGADFYTYWLMHNGSEENFDMVAVNFSYGKVYSVELGTWGDSLSEHTVLGIHAGESSGSAYAKAEEYFGEKGTALSDDKQMWGLTDMKYDYVDFGSDKKGWLSFSIDVETDTVITVEYSKF